MKIVLITGGAGFIGIHTSLLLLEKGYTVYIIDSLINSSPRSVSRLKHFIEQKSYSSYPKVDFKKGDIRDKEFLKNVFQEAKDNGSPISYVIHFAGLKSVKESIDNPFLYWDVNVNGTISLLDVMDEYDCKKIIFSSSATIYGLEEKSPLNENSKIKPFNPYGKTKAAVENFLSDLTDIPNNCWEIISLRYFNPIGAHFSGFFGESPKGVPNNLFPYICNVGSSKEKILKIFGNDWPTKDGTGIRDYIHIMDLAEGHLAAVEYISKENKKSCFLPINLGRGEGISVLELVNTFEKVNNIKINYKFTKRRAGDKDIVFADCKKANKILGWFPKRGIDEMCLDGWNWHKNNIHGY